MGSEIKSSREGGSPAGGSPTSPVTLSITDGTLIPERGRRGTMSAWRISIIGAVVFLVLLPAINMAPVQKVLHESWRAIFPSSKPDPILVAIGDGTYRNHYWAVLNFVPDGLIITFEVTVFAIMIATIIGLFAGLGQISRNVTLNKISTVYVEVIRGIPLIVQIFYIYYSLGQFLKLQGVLAAVVSLSICYGAYLGEIFRAGIQSIPRGQMEASLALGLSRRQAFRFVILPQTVKVILPALGNEFIALLKDSSLVSILALTDLMQRGKQYATRTFAYFETFTMVALMYLVLTLFLSRLVGLMEERLNRRGRR